MRLMRIGVGQIHQDILQTLQAKATIQKLIWRGRYLCIHITLVRTRDYLITYCDISAPSTSFI